MMSPKPSSVLIVPNHLPLLTSSTSTNLFIMVQNLNAVCPFRMHQAVCLQEGKSGHEKKCKKNPDNPQPTKQCEVCPKSSLTKEVLTGI